MLLSEKTYEELHDKVIDLITDAHNKERLAIIENKDSFIFFMGNLFLNFAGACKDIDGTSITDIKNDFFNFINKHIGEYDAK